ncbi:hypothetical protein N0V92_004555 [Colletotrichum tropicale]|nr:hypothetical protein N0V92_004555 [Colletotrichum tropicale]
MPTEDEYDRTMFEAYAAELAGSSHDRAMRPAIEQMVRQFFRAGDNLNRDMMMSFFNDNPTVITALDGPGHIWAGAAEVKRWIESWGKDMERVVPKMIIVDRGSVVCHTVTFTFNLEDSEAFIESHGVVIMDLDKDNCIERLEYRETNREDKTHEGGRELFDSLVEEAENDAISVDYLS